MPKVYIAVGHGRTPEGGYDPGATADNVTEQTAGDVVVAEMAAELRAAGVQVRDESHSDDPNFVGTTDEANGWHADLLISVHHDWVKAPPGWFAFWYPGSDHGERAARMLRAAVDEAGFGLRDDWFGPRGNLYVLNQTRMPAVLVECGKIGQYSDGELRALGRAHAAGVLAYFGIPRQQPAPDVEYDVAVVYDPSTDGRDEGAARVLGAGYSWKVLPANHTETVGVALLVGKAAVSADRGKYDRVVELAGSVFYGEGTDDTTADEVAAKLKENKRVA